MKSTKRTVLDTLGRKRLLAIADAEEATLKQRRALEPLRQEMSRKRLPRKTQRFLSRIEVTGIAQNESEPLQCKCGDTIAGRHGFIRKRFEAMHE